MFNSSSFNSFLFFLLYFVIFAGLLTFLGSPVHGVPRHMRLAYRSGSFRRSNSIQTGLHKLAASLTPGHMRCLRVRN